ncbi:MAG: hypothetical protein L0271_04645 [Gemmatimonadetes bacterium]|nr:hypothetical protein [Gemmatimonadota bacterium]
MRYPKILAIFGLVFSLGACNILDQDLDTENQNNPDRDRALAEAGDIESLIASGFQNWFYGFSGSSYPAHALSTAADEGTSSWGNYGMQHISSEPRVPWSNSTGYSYRGVAESPWYDLYEVISSMNDGLIAIEGGIQIGDNGAGNQRAKAFAKFMQALAHGYAALHFDRMFIFTEDMDLETTEFELVDYKAGMTEAIRMMDQAIAEMGTGTFMLEPHWIPFGTTITNTNLAKIANSYVARMMASVARTPEERAAVNWNEVLNRISKGVTSDFGIILDNTIWGEHYKFQMQRFDWYRSDSRMVGPSDISGAYQNWLSTPVQDRVDFDMNSLDKRVQGDGVGKNGTDFSYRRPQNHRADRGTYHFSRYHWTRLFYIRQTNIGWDPLLTVDEMNLLKAEALIRTGKPDEAVALINATRVSRGGLPPVTVNGVVGQADCVPKKIDDVNAGCANLMETLQYEKRIETYAQAAGLAFWDARGWGILIPGTVLHLPIPARELETLGLAQYTFGGVGNEGAAK